jgi:hypothetical protein
VIRDRYASLSLKAGHGAIWNSALVHGSFPNLTSDIRVAAAVWVQPSGSQLLHHRRIDRSRAARYEIDPTFFATKNPFAIMAAPPRLPHTTVDIGGHDLSADELASTLDGLHAQTETKPG